MSEEIQELKETLERSLQNPSLIDREKTERFYKGIINLQQKVEQLESIRKEAIKLIEEDILGKKIENVDWNYDECDYSDMPVERIKPLLDILNKGE